MTDLVAWLRAQLDEDERHAQKDLHVLASATADGQWEAHYGYNLPYSLLKVGEVEIGRLTATGGPQYHPSGHLVDGYEDRHNHDAMLVARLVRSAGRRAVRVLAEVAAKRRILDEIVEEANALDSCVDHDRRIEPRDDITEPYLGDALVRLLAEPYADRPGYREEWKP